jgi:site-specific recombinase XerC
MQHLRARTKAFDMVGISVCTSSEAGTDLAVIQALMGHDHVDSSAVYIHLAPIHLRAAYDAARARQRSFESS